MRFNFILSKWTKEQILAFLKIIKPRKVSLCREISDVYEVLFQLKSIVHFTFHFSTFLYLQKAVNVGLNTEDVAVVIPKLLLALSDVHLDIWNIGKYHFDVLRTCLQVS